MVAENADVVRGTKVCPSDLVQRIERVLANRQVRIVAAVGTTVVIVIVGRVRRQQRRAYGVHKAKVEIAFKDR